MASQPLLPSFIHTFHSDVYEAIDPARALAGTAKGKTVLITGAGRGIGRAISIAFAHAGASRIILTSRTSAQLDEVEQRIKEIKADIDVRKASMDICSEQDVEALFNSVSDKPVDVLVNNAGYLETVVPIAESDPTEWWQSWEINMKGTYLTTRQFLKRFTAGTIINTSSVGSIFTSHGLSAYQPSKTAVNRFTDFIHSEYPHIRTFSYHPGGVPTELASKLPPKYVLKDKPELAGGYCVWLSTEKADFLQGRYSSCNWDIGELMANADVIVEKDLLMQRIIMG